MKVKDVMKKAFVIEKDISLEKAAKIMSDDDIEGLVYVNSKDEIRGILTSGDLLENFNKDERVSEIMTKEVLTIESEDEILEALRLMKENKVKRLPVVNEGKLAGMVRLSDLAAHADELGEEFLF